MSTTTQCNKPQTKILAPSSNFPISLSTIPQLLLHILRPRLSLLLCLLNQSNPNSFFSVVFGYKLSPPRGLPASQVPCPPSTDTSGLTRSTSVAYILPISSLQSTTHALLIQLKTRNPSIFSLPVSPFKHSFV